MTLFTKNSGGAAPKYRLLLVGLVVLSTNLLMTSGEARPQYANEVGKQCNFCHIGQMGSKNFTQDGQEYCRYLKNNGLIAARQCRNETITLYDGQGNFVENYTHCVPYGPPSPC